ncbi:hypothetical protein Tco_1285067 [Tanacetum coccineum]
MNRFSPLHHPILSSVAVRNAVYDAHNEVACLMLGSMTPELHRQFENSSPYEILQELKSMFEKQAEVEWNYNMHNIGKTIGELHALLIEYEKGLPTKAATPQVMAIQDGRIQKANKKSLNAKGKGNGVRTQVKAIGSDDLVLPNGLGCEALMKRDTPDKLQQRFVKCIFIGYPNETMGYYFYSLLENKIVVASEIPMEIEGFEQPQEEVVPIRRSARTHRASDRLCLNVEVDERSLGDLNKPNNYKAAILDPKSDKWVDAMNSEIQSINDNQVWCLVDLPPNCASTPEEVKHMQNVPYASAVGSIIYAVRCTRPDVAFVQNLTSRFQQNPREPHLTAVKTILSSKQSTTAMSATEAEYIAASKATIEAVWFRKFISGLGIVPTINEPINMFYDNSAALLIANEPGVQRGARHYHRRYHYVRECIKLGEINFIKVHTYDNLVDPFTKALSKGKITQTC